MNSTSIMQKNHNKGLLIIITGITASGKDTIKQRLLNHYPQMQKIITTLSRPLRTGEKNGDNHYFISKEKFLEQQKKGEFLETNEYAGNLYGTYKSEIKKVLLGTLIIWQIDPSAAAKVSDFITQGFEAKTAQAILNRTLVIFIDAPDQDILVKRMQQRGMDPESINKRIKQDQENLKKYKSAFPHIVVNQDGQFEKTIQQITNMIDSF